MNTLGTLGFILILSTTGAACLLGSKLSIFIDIPSFIIVSGIVVGLVLTSFNKNQMILSLKILSTPFFKNAWDNDKEKAFLVVKSIRTYVYVAGTVGTLIPLIQAFAHMTDISSFGPSVAISLLAIFYSLLIDVLFLLPSERILTENQ